MSISLRLLKMQHLPQSSIKSFAQQFTIGVEIPNKSHSWSYSGKSIAKLKPTLPYKSVQSLKIAYNTSIFCNTESSYQLSAQHNFRFAFLSLSGQLILTEMKNHFYVLWIIWIYSKQSFVCILFVFSIYIWGPISTIFMSHAKIIYIYLFIHSYVHYIAKVLWENKLKNKHDAMMQCIQY